MIQTFRSLFIFTLEPVFLQMIKDKSMPVASSLSKTTRWPVSTIEETDASTVLTSANLETPGVPDTILVFKPKVCFPFVGYASPVGRHVVHTGT